MSNDYISNNGLKYHLKQAQILPKSNHNSNPILSKNQANKILKTLGHHKKLPITRLSWIYQYGQYVPRKKSLVDIIHEITQLAANENVMTLGLLTTKTLPHPIGYNIMKSVKQNQIQKRCRN